MIQKKRKYVLIGIVVVSLLLIGTGSFVYWKQKMVENKIEKLVTNFLSSSIVDSLEKEEYQFQGYYLKGVKKVRINIRTKTERTGVVLHFDEKENILKVSLSPEAELQKVAVYALIASLSRNSDQVFRKLNLDVYDQYSLSRDGVDFPFVGGLLTIRIDLTTKINLEKVQPELVEG